MPFAALLVCVLMQDPAPVAAAREALAAAVAREGERSLAVSDAATGLGNRLVDAGRFADGAAEFARALRIREELLGEDHAKTRVAMSNLANAAMADGDAARAVPLLERAVASFERTAVSDRSRVGTLLGLGAACKLLGQYRRSRDVLESAVAIAREVCPEHPYAALAQQALATTLMDFGEVERARTLVEDALAIAEREPRSQPCAHAVFGIGIALGNAGRHDEALPVLQRGLGLVRQAFGADSAKVALSAALFAGFLRDAGQAEPAAAMAREVLAIAKERGGLFARARAQAHGVLSTLAAAAGRAEAALAEARAMLAARDPALTTTTDLARQLAIQGHALAAAGELDPAIDAFRRAIATFAQDAADNGIGDGVGQVEVRSALAAVLARRGDLAGAVAERRHALAAFRANVDLLLPAMLEAQRLRAVQRHRGNLDALLALARAEPTVLSPARQHAEVLAWKGQVARGIERSLAAARQQPETAAALARLQQLVRQSGGGPEDTALVRERQALSARLAPTGGAVDAATVAAGLGERLPPGTALVDFLVAADADGVLQVLAFVVRAGQPTVRVDLGPHAPLRDAIARHLLITSRRLRPGLGGEPLAAAAGQALRALVWQPLVAALGDATRVVLGPDDVLAELPFETLPGARAGTFLVEDLAIAYVQNGLDLARAPLAAGPRSLLAIGDIDYGAAPAAPPAAPGPFVALPGTRQELADVRAAFGDGVATVLTGAAAAEGGLLAAAAGASFVHLATHGFCRTARDGGAAGAGVALAGANRGPSPGGDDGVLTSDEAALLDLRACRLVTLSACQSGLGTPVSGEHLLGLRRSLHIAGARTTLTSLWRVDDAQTAALMGDFYRALWQQGLPPDAALRHAQLARIAGQRQAGEVLPGTWGAFVVEGCW